jgi:hypothetical protein
MIISTTTDLKNGVYLGQVETEVNAIDSEFIGEYGEPQIDVLGNIPYTDHTSAPQTMVLGGGPSLVYVRSGMPIKFQVNGNNDLDAQQKVDGWCIEMKTRIAAVMATLKAKPLLTVPAVTRYEA